jgi:hypothetical protein
MKMETCPRDFNDEFIKNLALLDERFGKEHLMKSLSECSISGGSKKRRKSMRGGTPYTKKNIKIALYVIFAALCALALSSETAQSMIPQGISMLMSGKCSFLSNRLMGAARLDNPICRAYNKIIFDVMKSFGELDFEAFSTIVGKITVATAIPLSVGAVIDSVATRVEAQMKGHMDQMGNSAANPFDLITGRTIGTNALSRQTRSRSPSRSRSSAASGGSKRRRKTKKHGKKRSTRRR